MVVVVVVVVSSRTVIVCFSSMEISFDVKPQEKANIKYKAFSNNPTGND